MESTYADFYRPSLSQRATRWLKKHWKVVGGALGAISIGYAGAVLSEIAPAPDSARALACWAGEWWSEPAPGTHFTILVSNLAGDGNGQQTKLIRDVFLGQRGLDVRRTCRVVALDGRGGAIAEREAKAINEGHALLRDWNADLLIWGEVRKENSELSLWFLTREGDSTLGRAPYSVSENLTLPLDFKEDLAAQLEAMAFAQIVPATSADADRLAELLKPPAEKLRQLLWAGQDVLPRPRTALMYSFADALAAIGIQTAEPEWLEQAVAAYDEVLSQWTRKSVPLGWAAAQQSKGAPLYHLGLVRDDPAFQERAIEAYRISLDEWTRAKILPRVISVAYALQQAFSASEVVTAPHIEGVAASFRNALVVLTQDAAPEHWASTQNYLGAALRQLGERERNTAILKEAVSAHRAALEELTREHDWYGWAWTQNGLGDALRALGQQEGDAARLEEAITAHRAALQELNRQRDGYDWAWSQNSLGYALTALGEQEGEAAHLEAAIAAYRVVLEELTRERDGYDWAWSQNHLGLALRILGEQEGDAARVQEAITAHQVALEELSRERDRYAWAWSQNHLGLALRVLGEQEGDAARLQEAISAHRAALEELSRERDRYAWAWSQNHLGLALRVLGEQQGDAARLQEAIAAHRAALKEIVRERQPFRWAEVQEDLGLALQARGQRETGTTELEQAIESIRAALEIFKEAGAGYNVEKAQANLARAEALLAEQQGRSAAE